MTPNISIRSWPKPLGPPEIAEYAAVHVEHSRTAQNVSPTASEAHVRYGLEGERIEVRLAYAVPAEDLNVAFYLVRRLSVAGAFTDVPDVPT